MFPLYVHPFAVAGDDGLMTLYFSMLMPRQYLPCWCVNYIIHFNMSIRFDIVFGFISWTLWMVQLIECSDSGQKYDNDLIEYYWGVSLQQSQNNWCDEIRAHWRSITKRKRDEREREMLGSASYCMPMSHSITFISNNCRSFWLLEKKKSRFSSRTQTQTPTWFYESEITELYSKMNFYMLVGVVIGWRERANRRAYRPNTHRAIRYPYYLLYFIIYGARKCMNFGSLAGTSERMCVQSHECCSCNMRIYTI